MRLMASIYKLEFSHDGREVLKTALKGEAEKTGQDPLACLDRLQSVEKYRDSKVLRAIVKFADVSEIGKTHLVHCVFNVHLHPPRWEVDPGFAG